MDQDHHYRQHDGAYPPSPNHSTPPLGPPQAPFSQRSPSAPSMDSPSNRDSVASGTAVSLSVNYLPSKFSRPHSPGVHKRKNAASKVGNNEPFPKRGGGREAFGAGEARMPSDGDDDYDGVAATGFFGRNADGKSKPKLRWNKFKWILFFANLLLTTYSLLGLIFVLLTWFNVWTHADIVRVANTTELILSTIAASVGLVTSLLGWSGILLNNRAFLAVYAVMLWVTLAFLVAPGYITYKKKTFNLEGKVNLQWSQHLGVLGRLRIQDQLHCCGYFSPFIEATVSQACYSRSTLPGCKGDFIRFERMVLTRWFTVVFSIVPAHLILIVTTMLCSNHITYRWGKGMMPKAYRLSLGSMAVIMDNYASQLAEQYGHDVASDILNRSRSNLNIDQMPTMPYASGTPPSYGHSGGYGSLSGAHQ